MARDLLVMSRRRPLPFTTFDGQPPGPRRDPNAVARAAFPPLDTGQKLNTRHGVPDGVRRWRDATPGRCDETLLQAATDHTRTKFR